MKNRLPERDFFFGILGTVKPEYLKDIVAAAHKNRFAAEKEESKKSAIMITDQWFHALQASPYHSSKVLS
jgi:hypothetical protein